MSTAADRGKRAEALVKKKLTSMSSKQGFVHYRLPDARAGSFAATLADFLILWRGMLVVLEVKQVEHDYRLSYNNFSPSQVSRQRLWDSAGARSLVLVYHNTSDLWRCCEVERFLDRSVGGSWDLRAEPHGKLDEVFECQLNRLYPLWVQSLGSGSI